MNNKIKTYYIPVNPNIKQGTIYTLYLNNNNNLDLSKVLEEEKITLNNIITPFKENKIIIENNDYNKLMSINTKITEHIKEINNLNCEFKVLLSSLSNERKI